MEQVSINISESNSESSENSNNNVTLLISLPPSSPPHPHPHVNQLTCTHCTRTFQNESEFSRHINRFTRMSAIQRVLMRNGNGNNLFTPSLFMMPQASSHAMLFPKNGRFHPYNRPNREVPIFPPPIDHNVDESNMGRTLDLISLLDKPIDLKPVIEEAYDNDINLDLKL